ncbi:MAG: Gldg family protein [Ignavibacteriaceae bacterium]|nr:Gldg family protein [Ignavibacteriaceae bacterium]NUM71412.1 Gldg family protein [Ignavibacteriaceae bacterium]
MTRKKLITAAALLIIITIAVNIISSQFFFRLDLTSDKSYTLSDATKNLLGELKDPVTVKAYFSEQLPSDISKVRDDFRAVLSEYAALSDDNIVYEFINPNKDQISEGEAQSAGIRPVMINVRERDQIKQQRAYLGAVLKYKDKTEVIPVITPNSSMEYPLTTAIKKLVQTNKTKIGVLQGYGASPVGFMKQLTDALSILYDVQPLILDDTTKIPPFMKTIFVQGVTDSLPASVLNDIDQFIMNGGRVLFAVKTSNAGFSNEPAQEIKTGLNTLLLKYGLKTGNELITDVSCGSVMIQQQQFGLMIQTPMQLPFLPVISKFEEHPVTTGLDAILLAFPSPVYITEKRPGIKTDYLAYTSDRSGKVKMPAVIDVNREWSEQDFNESHIPVAASAVLEKSGGKIILIGQGDFFVNGEQGQQLEADNINLIYNSLDWLSDDTGLIEVRTKGVSARPFAVQLQDSTKSFVKYMNFLVPLIIVALIGIYRYRTRKQIREELESVSFTGDKEE